MESRRKRNWWHQCLSLLLLYPINSFFSFYSVENNYIIQLNHKTEMKTNKIHLLWIKFSLKPSWKRLFSIQENIEFFLRTGFVQCKFGVKKTLAQIQIYFLEYNVEYVPESKKLVFKINLILEEFFIYRKVVRTVERVPI